jgi:hypothetical protein
MSNEKRYHNPAEEIMEIILDEVVEAIYSYRLVPFQIAEAFRCSLTNAHHEHPFPNRKTLRYPLLVNPWYDPDDPDAPPQDAELLLLIADLPRHIYSRCKVTLERILLEHFEGEDIFTPDTQVTLLEEYAHDVMRTYLYRIPEKITAAFNEAYIETHFLSLINLYARLARTFADIGRDVLYDPYNELEHMKQTLSEIAAMRRRLLREEVAANLGKKKVNFSELGEHYKKLLQVWKDAKLIYKQNSNRATWREIIRAAYPEVKFDDDLISRLSGKLNDLSEEIQAKLSEKGGDSKPSSIALEHAARMCGARPYQYSLRHLYNIKNENERRRTSNDEENSH